MYFVHKATYYTNTKSKKDDNGVKYKHAYKVIYLLYTACEPNIITLAQVVLEIFCSQAFIGLQIGKREIIMSLIKKILRKVNQVIYNLDTICEPNITLQLKRFLSHFVHKITYYIKQQCLKGRLFI